MTSTLFAAVVLIYVLGIAGGYLLYLVFAGGGTGRRSRSQQRQK